MSERGRGEREGLHWDREEEEGGEGGGEGRGADLSSETRSSVWISAAAASAQRTVGDLRRGRRDQLQLARREEEEPGWDRRW